MYMNQKYKATGFDQIVVGGFEKIMQGKLLKKNSVRRHTQFERFWEMGPLKLFLKIMTSPFCPKIIDYTQDSG